MQFRSWEVWAWQPFSKPYYAPLCADAAVIGEKQPFGPILRSFIDLPQLRP